MTDFEEPDFFEDLPSGEGVVALSTDGIIMAANLPAEKILKTRLEPGSRLSRDRIFGPDHQAQAELAFREAVQGGHSKSFLNAEIRTGDDALHTVEYSVFPLRNSKGAIIGLLLTFNEISANKGGLVHGKGITETEYQMLFENLAEGVFTVNFHMRITSFNRRAQELTGFRPVTFWADSVGKYSRATSVRAAVPCGAVWKRKSRA